MRECASFFFLLVQKGFHESPGRKGPAAADATAEVRLKGHRCRWEVYRPSRTRDMGAACRIQGDTRRAFLIAASNIRRVDESAPRGAELRHESIASAVKRSVDSGYGRPASCRIRGAGYMRVTR